MTTSVIGIACGTSIAAVRRQWNNFTNNRHRDKAGHNHSDSSAICVPPSTPTNAQGAVHLHPRGRHPHGWDRHGAWGLQECRPRKRFAVLQLGTPEQAERHYRFRRAAILRGNNTGQGVVTFEPSDVASATQTCQTWQKVG